MAVLCLIRSYVVEKRAGSAEAKASCGPELKTLSAGRRQRRVSYLEKGRLFPGHKQLHHYCLTNKRFHLKKCPSILWRPEYTWPVSIEDLTMRCKQMLSAGWTEDTWPKASNILLTSEQVFADTSSPPHLQGFNKPLSKEKSTSEPETGPVI